MLASSSGDFTQTLRGEMPAFAASLAFMDQYRGHYPSNMSSLRRVQPRFDPEETDEWLESLESVLHTHGPTRARFLLHELGDEASRAQLSHAGKPWRRRLKGSKARNQALHVAMMRRSTSQTSCRW